VGTLILNAQTLLLGKLEVQDYDIHSCTQTHEVTKVDRTYCCVILALSGNGLSAKAAET